MEPQAIAELLKDGGPWGLVTVLLAVIALLWKSNNDRAQETLAVHKEKAEEVKLLAEKTATGLASGTNAVNLMTAEIAALNLKYQGISSASTALVQATETVSRQVENNRDKLERLNDYLRSEGR